MSRPASDAAFDELSKTIFPMYVEGDTVVVDALTRRSTVLAAELSCAWTGSNSLATSVVILGQVGHPGQRSGECVKGLRDTAVYAFVRPTEAVLLFEAKVVQDKFHCGKLLNVEDVGKHFASFSPLDTLKLQWCAAFLWTSVTWNILRGFSSKQMAA